MNLTLLENYKRPVVQLCSTDLWMLIDTGAEIPVWTESFQYFSRKFTDAYKLDKFYANIVGFNGANRSDVYIIPRVEIVEGELFLLNLPVAFSRLRGRRPFSLIIPICVLSDCTITKYINRKGIVSELLLQNHNIGPWIGCKVIHEIDDDTGEHKVTGASGSESKLSEPVPKEVFLQQLLSDDQGGVPNTKEY